MPSQTLTGTSDMSTNEQTAEEAVIQFHLDDKNDSLLKTAVEDRQGITFLWMELTPGTSRLNIVAMLTLYFALYLFLYIKTGALGYLLQADYGVSL
jgi:hypothetical protein